MRTGHRVHMTLALVATLVGALLIPAPASSVPSQKRIVGSGILQCDDGVGSITMEPPWSDSTSGNVTGTVRFTSWSCGGSGAPDPIPVKARVIGTISFQNGSCTAHGPTNFLAFDGQLRVTYDRDVTYGTKRAPSLVILKLGR
jgi:hypothetical protein